MIEPYFLCYHCGADYVDAGLAVKEPSSKNFLHKEKCAACGRTDYGDLYHSPGGGSKDD